MVKISISAWNLKTMIWKPSSTISMSIMRTLMLTRKRTFGLAQTVTAKMAHSTTRSYFGRDLCVTPLHVSLHFAIHIVWRANVICTYRKSGIARKTTVAYPELRLTTFPVNL